MPVIVKMAAIHGQYRSDCHFYCVCEYVCLTPRIQQSASFLSFSRRPIRELNFGCASLSRYVSLAHAWRAAKWREIDDYLTRSLDGISRDKANAVSYFIHHFFLIMHEWKTARFTVKSLKRDRCNQ